MTRSKRPKKGRMTESEELFHRFCKSQGWRVGRIGAAPGRKVPDFFVRLGNDAGIVVEVKQFDPNTEEREVAEGKGSRVLGGKPGNRVRQVLTKANSQLKSLEGSHPGMVVLQNRTPCSLHDDPYAVLTAMHGMDVVRVPLDPSGGVGSLVRFGRYQQGPEAKLNPERNTSVSCIAVLRELFDGVPVPFGLGGPDPEHDLAVYHNPFAKLPLDPSRLVGSRVTHYRMNEDQSLWEPVPCEPSR
ncbi:MAG: hypothetical protein OXR82_19675 [Gammaproteobacteria bacterium]|nr:hypothetical protein [Gammaproteobacteria bacterium]